MIRMKMNLRSQSRSMFAIGILAFACVVGFQNCSLNGAFPLLEVTKTEGGSSTKDPVPDFTAPEKVSEAPPLRMLSNEEYYRVVSDLVGQNVPRALFSGWGPSPVAFDFDTVGAGLIDSKETQDRLTAAEEISEIAVGSPTVMVCQPGATAVSWNACAQQILERFAFRAFRRPPTSAEMTVIKGVFDQVSGQALGTFSDDIDSNFDVATNDLGVHGWVFDKQWEERYVEVHFYVQPPGAQQEFAGATLADRPRGDVNSVKNVKGDHGFAFRLPAKYADGRQYTVRAYAIGGPGKNNPELASSGKTFTGSSAGGPISFNQLSTPFRDGLKASLQSILTSPNFLYKFEQPIFAKGDTQTLGDFELASRLSFLIMGSIPDDELFALAQQGKLKDPAVLRAQATRLLDQYGDRFAMTFAGQWLGFRRYALKYATQGPQDDTGVLESAMAEESKLVFKRLIDKNYTIDALLEPGFTFVNQRLAQHYGMSTPAGGGFQMIASADRGGVLMQGSVLRMTSNPDSTHPIRRGRWVLGSLLCEPLPLADSALRMEIDEVTKSLPPNLSVSERLIAHRTAGQSCLGCHAKMDPIGLGLENYDAFGRWRTKYPNNSPVVSKTDLQGVPFNNGRELSTILRDQEAFRRCVVRKTMTYVFSRGLRISETATKENPDTSDDALLDALTKKSPTLRNLVLDLVSSESFRSVRRPAGQ